VIITSSGEVVLSGVFSHVEIKGDVKLTVASGSIDNLTVDESAAGAEIQLQKGANVDHMTLRGATEIKGEGTIGLAIVDASGIAFQTEPVAKEVTE
jgi:ADP-glucose pyrophosphorylase